MTNLKVLLTALVAALMVGCGGGSDAPDTPPPPVADNTVPASAWASVQSFVQYVASLMPSETAEPRDLGQGEPPRSDTEEPRDL
jgi:hypothetical protein